VEKTRFQLGLGTTNSFSKRIWIYGFLGYGLGDQKWKYGGWVQYKLQNFPRHIIGGAYRKVIEQTTVSSEELNTGVNILAGLYRRPIPQKLLEVKEAKLFYEKYWQKGWTQRVTLINRILDPVGNIGSNLHNFSYRYYGDNEQIPDSTINTTEVIFKTRYAYKEKFLDGQFVRQSLGSKFPIVTFTYSLGLKGVLGSEYNYHRLSLQLEHYFYINPMGWTYYLLRVGKTFGRVPYLLAEIHQGNESYAYNSYAFNVMNRYEFASDMYATLTAVHHFEGFLLNRIPLLRKLKWREIVQFRAVWGSLSDENALANRDNYADSKKTVPIRAPHTVPYMEWGAGIENIFKIIRIDALWRLNYLDNPEATRFTVKGSLYFTF
jgi:hypothetical protein